MDAVAPTAACQQCERYHPSHHACTSAVDISPIPRPSVAADVGLRDYFAGKVLASANAAKALFGTGGELELAAHCYRLADAMLVARAAKIDKGGGE
jgi:hypothetical protein